MLRTLEEWRIYAFEHDTSGDMAYSILKDWEESLSIIYSNLMELKTALDVWKYRGCSPKEDHICEYMENGHCKICGESYNGH